ncbi:MAG: type II secretion system protein GspG [Verrucomicrobia bacterium]|nr:type II secretion system protein GspG [Verrucomicrobiota bacterium]
MQRRSNMKKTKKNDAQRKNAGFTLIEMLLVITIIGILAAVVVTQFSGVTRDTSIAATRQAIANISTAIDAYEINMGKLPSSLSDLVSNPGGANWRGPYIRGGVEAMKDGWGQPIQYSKTSETAYDLKSPGPDGQMGNDDDITGFTSAPGK